MDKDVYFTAVYRNLLDYGFDLKKEKIDRVNVVVATKKEFSLSSETTYMNIFVVMAISKNLTKDIAKKFFKVVLDYTEEYSEGLPQVLQADIVCFALLASRSVSEDAKQWVEQGIKKYRGAYELPIIFDYQNDNLYYCKTPSAGAAYYKHFGELFECFSGPEKKI
jgi:hypothetical protein